MLSSLTLPAAERAALEAVKITALASGVRIGDRVLRELGGVDALTIHEYATTGGITLRLPHGVLVNAPFDSGFVESSPLELVRERDGLVLRSDDTSAPVEEVLPLPGYLARHDANGDAVADTVMSHADRLRVSPIVGCAYDCRFCDLAAVRYRARPVEQILRAIDVARTDPALPARHILISGGSPPVNHERGQDYFRDVCVKVAEHLRGATAPDGSRFEVDIMMSARPDGPAFVDRLVDAGVTGFSLNVEVFSEDAARRHIPLKRKWSREHLGPMIERAVQRLGTARARVRSLIIPGLEPVEATLEGVEWLASLGCSPVLSPFRPAPGTALADAPPVSREVLRMVLDGAREIVRRHGVLLGPACVPCQHNTLSFPWDVEGADQ